MSERLSHHRTVPLAQSHLERLRALQERVPLRGATLLRELALVGLELVERDPSLLVRPRVVAGGGA